MKVAVLAMLLFFLPASLVASKRRPHGFGRRRNWFLVFCPLLGYPLGIGLYYLPQLLFTEPGIVERFAVLGLFVLAVRVAIAILVQKSRLSPAAGAE